MQQGRSLAGLVHKELSTKVMEVVAPDVVPKTLPVPGEMIDALRQSLDALSEKDWQDSESGVYPQSLLFDIPWLALFNFPASCTCTDTRGPPRCLS